MLMCLQHVDPNPKHCPSFAVSSFRPLECEHLIVIPHTQMSSHSLSLSGPFRSAIEKEAISIQRTILHFTMSRQCLEQQRDSKNNSLELTIHEAQLGTWQKEWELGFAQNKGMGPKCCHANTHV